MRNIGIYIHIPFCKSKCFYCDFYSKTNCSETKIDMYINSICEEILANSEILESSVIDTVYFGGGTPSLIESKYIIKILDLLKLFTSNIKEITIEGNPESLTYDKLTSYFKSGITRLSIGLQSVNDTTLKNIGRTYILKDFEQAYNNAVEIGFKNISCDIILGLPNETLEMFSNTIDYVLSLKHITHISSYSLEVHENTKLNFLVKNNFLTLPDDSLERQMKYLLDKRLEQNGFNRYEISNYSKLGYESKHNLIYWNQEEYLGFGSAASSFISNTRYTNISDIDSYIQNIKKGLEIREIVEQMDQLDILKEYIILKLRLHNGINLLEFKNRFKQDIMDLFKQEIDKLENQGLLTISKGNLHLTYKGEDLANLVWQEFI